MTFSRIALFCTALLLLSLLGLGLYGYQNLPALAARQAKVYLQEYGVQDIRFEAFDISEHELGTQQLWLRGESDGLVFEATVSSLQLAYDWRMLLDGQLQSITLQNLDLTVEQVAPGTGAAPERLSVASVHPQALIAQLPLQSLHIKQWTLNYRAPGVQPISIVGDLRLTEQLSLNLETSYLGTRIDANIRVEEDYALSARMVSGDEASPVSTLQAQLEPGPVGHWRWKLQGGLDYARVLTWLRGLEPDPGATAVIAQLEGLELLGSSKINVTIDHPDELDVSNVGAALLEQFSATVQLHNTIERLDYPAVVRGAAGELDVALELDAGRLQLTLEPTELTAALWTRQLALPQDTQTWLRWGETVPIRWQNLQRVEIATIADGGWSVQLGNSLLVLGPKESQLQLERLNLDTAVYPGEQVRADTRLGASIKTRLTGKQLPQMELKFQHTGSLEDSELKLALADTAESMSLDAQSTVNLNTGKGNYSLDVRSLDLPYAASTVLPLLKKFRLFSETVEIAGGSISFNSELSTETFELDSLQQEAQLQIQNVSGSYGEYQFEGMALAAGWSGVEQWATRESVEFSLAKLNVGFDLVDIQARMRLPKATPIARPQVSLEQFTAGMFGGRVYLPEPARWDFGRDGNKLTLRAEQWQLADLVALQQEQDIQARGVLEGELPVTLTGGRIIIENGYLRALPPGGSIRYIANEASQALAASSSELGLALDLLSDFQFEVLSTEVGLDKAGNLLLELSLSGKNPAQYEGRPINFNINLEQNLDPLLQSLRLSDKLVEKIEGRLQ
jgi:Dicarboxylate transport